MPKWSVRLVLGALEGLVTDPFIAPRLNRLRAGLGLPPVQRILKNDTFRNIHLIEPLPYLPFIALLDRATVILTDSRPLNEIASHVIRVWRRESVAFASKLSGGAA